MMARVITDVYWTVLVVSSPFAVRTLYRAWRESR